MSKIKDTEIKATVGDIEIVGSLYFDCDPISPREWDNLGTMACYHSRYTLGDEGVPYKDEVIDMLEGSNNDVICLPLRLYDHSGLAMSTHNNGAAFGDPWDSMWIGAIFVEKAKIREEYGWKYLTKKRINQILQYLEGEVETYDQYLRGDVYGITVEGGEGGDESCWGYYGYDYAKSELKSTFRYVVEQELKKMKVKIVFRREVHISEHFVPASMGLGDIEKFVASNDTGLNEALEYSRSLLIRPQDVVEMTVEEACQKHGCKINDMLDELIAMGVDVPDDMFKGGE